MHKKVKIDLIRHKKIKNASHVNTILNFYAFSAIRVLGAAQYMGFSKLLRLSSPNDGSLGQFLTFCTGDQERIAESVIGGLLFVGKNDMKQMLRLRQCPLTMGS